MLSIPLIEFLNIGGSEMILIFIAILLLFGGKKLPELARGLGKGLREFKDASDGVKREIQRNINSIDLDDDPQTTAQRTYREPEEDSYSIHSKDEEINSLTATDASEDNKKSEEQKQNK